MSEEEQKPEEELANFDPWVEGGGVHGFIGKPVASYTIVFDDEESLKRFYAFFKGLKKVYPNIRTIGGRINQFLIDREAGLTPTPPEVVKKPKSEKKIKADKFAVVATDSDLAK